MVLEHDQFCSRKRVVVYVQHDNTDSEAALRLHAIAPDLLIFHNVAVLGNVPRCAIVDSLRVDSVGQGLNVNAVCPN